MQAAAGNGLEMDVPSSSTGGARRGFLLQFATAENTKKSTLFLFL